MDLKSITIKKLFGLFDYKIDFNQDENLTILTGPNGYGKTTILNIIYSLFNQRFFYFQKLNFEFIQVYFSDGNYIEISKKKGKERTERIIRVVDEERHIIDRKVETIDVEVKLSKDAKNIQTFLYNSEVEDRIFRELERYYSLTRIDSNLLIDDRTGEQINLYDFINDNSEALPEKALRLIKGVNGKNKKILNLLNSVNIYLIKEQRLLKQSYKNQSNRRMINTSFSYINTIEDYAKELMRMISDKQLEAYQVAQELDSSFPKRLISTKKELSKSEFDERFGILREKQKQLQEFGISISGQEVTEYDEENAKVLTVYLEDSEKKVMVYDDLLNKIDLFVTILNEKRFTFKSIKIDKKRGFYFKTTTEDNLNLTDLSSGEQHEVVLLYELLFKTNPNTLILIDEPEISLHVIWQKAFISDLQEISKMKNISFLVSTHSPQIINNRWDLTKDLFELSKSS